MDKPGRAYREVPERRLRRIKEELSRLKAVDNRNSIQTYDFRPKVYFLAKTDVFILFGPSSNYFQGCKSFHRLQTHSILTAVVTGIECSHRTGPPLPTNRDLPAGRFAEPGDNRGEPAGGPAGLLSLSFLTHANDEIGCKQNSSGSFSPISFPVFASLPPTPRPL